MPQAQAAGQKAQQDAQRGQGSIFDLGEPAPGPPPAEPDLPVPGLPDEREQLNAWEKETLGLFLLEPPAQGGAAGAAPARGLLAGRPRRKKDGEWVTVGGMITECKRIRTRKGDPMMFATLDDLEGQVEMLVFNSAYAPNADKVDVDRIVLVRGRVDHKEAGEIKLVAQEVELFEPTPRRCCAPPRRRRPSRSSSGSRCTWSPGVPESFLEELKEVVGNHPGEHELVLAVGGRRLVLGTTGACPRTARAGPSWIALPGAARLVVSPSPLAAA